MDNKLSKGCLVKLYYPQTFGLTGIYLTVSNPYDAARQHTEETDMSVVDILVNGRAKMIAVVCLDVVSQ